MIGSTTTVHCNGCTNVLVTSWTLGASPTMPADSYKAPPAALYTWKRLNASKAGPRLDFCPICISAGRAHR